MAPTSGTPYWQICMQCDRREYNADPVTCRCGNAMVDVLDHPDNAHRKEKPSGKKPPAGTSSAPPAKNP